MHGLLAVFDNGGTQALVPVRDFLEAALQRAGIEFAAQAQGLGNIVKRAGGLELLQKPQALLRERSGTLFVKPSRVRRWIGWFPEPV